MGPEIVAALQAAAPYVAAAGTAASMYGDKVAADERRSILNKAFRRTEESQDKTNKQVLDEGAKLTGQQRMADMQAQADANVLQSTQDLKGGAAMDAQGNAIIDTAGSDGNVSSDYVKAKADKALGEGERLSSIARELAKVRAPGQVATTESQRRADMTSGLNSMWSSTRNLNSADTLDAQNVDSPWWGKLGKVAQMVGMAAMAMPAAAGAGAGSAGMTGMQLGDMGATAGSGLDFGAGASSSWWGKPGLIKFGG